VRKLGVNQVIPLIALLLLDMRKQVIRRTIDRGKELAKQGRELALKRDELVTKEDIDFLNQVAEYNRSLYELLHDLYTKTRNKVIFWLSFIALVTWGRIAFTVQYYLEKIVGKARKSDRLVEHLPREDVEWIVTHIGVIDEAHRRILNKPCLQILDKVETEENYTFASLLTDVTACHEAFILTIEKVLN
jgi:hypothetical protein